jgi:hypothetical protein
MLTAKKWKSMATARFVSTITTGGDASGSWAMWFEQAQHESQKLSLPKMRNSKWPRRESNPHGATPQRI